jgi:predicted nucleic acid-binding protein
MMLADTSIWIDHFRQHDGILARLLEEQKILMHPFVIGKLALGSLKRRRQILSELANLPLAAKASDDEVLVLIERNHLAGSGIGYIDAHLLASAGISGASVWTRDKRLHQVALNLGMALQH